MGRLTIEEAGEDFALIRRRINTCPSCTTSEEYAEWMKEARKIKPPYTTWFCTDCTPEFAAMNRSRGTCDYPKIRFRKDKDGGIEGYNGK